MRDDFAIFILSHNRADRVSTISALQKSGYTGKYYLVIDNEDETISEYITTFGEDKIIVFDKLATSMTFDSFDLSNNRSSVVYARNECFQIAKKLGLKYFLQLDDDYCRFEYRYEQDDKLMTSIIPNFDYIVECMIGFLDDSDALTVAFAQGGDLIGGKDSPRFKQRLIRKAMNSFFCSVDRPFKFIGRINEDVNTYVTLGNRGHLFFTVTNLDLVQIPTQQNKGGMSDIYLSLGTYTKSFYSVITSPSSVHLDVMGTSHKRIHHKINWESCCPKIISSKFKKCQGDIYER